MEDVGVALTDRGQIAVDEDFETNIEGIFAIGDVIEGPMLLIRLRKMVWPPWKLWQVMSGHVDYDLVPGIVYTAPEIATLGKTEDALKDAGIAYKKGVFPFLANSRARAAGHEEGLLKF